MKKAALLSLLIFSALLTVSAINTSGEQAQVIDDNQFTYWGIWNAHNDANAYGGGVRWNSGQGNHASIRFEGSSVILYYTQYTTRGDVNVYLDGNYITTFSQYGQLEYQKQWQSPLFDYGTHTIYFVNAGTGIVDVDAIEVQKQHPNFNDLHIFVLVGQSNGVGYDTPPTQQGISNSIFLFGNDYRWKFAKEPIDDSISVVDAVSADTFGGYSPGTAFARALQGLRGEDYHIGLVPCAKGGSSIAQWRKSHYDTTLYGSCLKRLRAASVMGEISGIISYQGETDAQTETGNLEVHREDWGDEFIQFISDIRADVGNPNLSVVFVQIGNLPAAQFAYKSVVQTSQASVSGYNIEMVSAIGLPEMSDGIHRSVAGQDALGLLLAESMDQLLEEQ